MSAGGSWGPQGDEHVSELVAEQGPVGDLVLPEPLPRPPYRPHRRRNLVVASLLVLAVAAGAVVVWQRETGAPPAEQAVAQILERRTEAVERGDEALFLADLDPMATDFVEEQRQLFDNLLKLPLTNVAWEPAGYSLVTVEPQIREGQEAYVPVVWSSHQLRGFDERPVKVKQALTFVRRGAHWYLHGDDDGDATEFAAAPEIWEVEPIAVARTSRAIVIGSVEDADELEGMARLAQQAVADVDDLWSAAHLNAVVVTAPRDRDLLDLVFPSDRPNGPDAGIEWPVFDDRDRAGERITINTDEVPPGDHYMSVLLRHEVTHVATARWTKPGTPRWLVEGAAEWTAYRKNPGSRLYFAETFDRAATGHLLDALPSNGSFYDDSTGYDTAFLLNLYIVLKHGEKDLVRLYRTSQIELSGQSRDEERPILRRVLGVSEQQLLTGFDAWARRNVRAD